MTKRRWLLLIGFITLWVISGGPSIHNFTFVAGSHDFERSRVKMRVGFRVTHQELRVPLLFNYLGQGMPAKLHVQLVDVDGQWESVQFDELTIASENTPEQAKATSWRGEFKPSPAYVWNEAKGEAEKDKSRFCEVTSDLSIDRFGAHTFSIKGKLIKRNGDAVLFEERGTIVATGWNTFRIYPYTLVSLIESTYKT